MMTSYLITGLASESVPQNHRTNLFDLVWLDARPFWLQVQYLLNSILREDVMASARSFLKAETLEELTDTAKRDVGIRRPAKDLLEQLVEPRHGATPGSQRDIPMFLRRERRPLSFQQSEG